ncbi:basic salivary proline-rich protein 1-like [Hemicordylus capensis]|uniref:basic salivary proline-rich protein 1-like n=1 Tax=Hemicordylus capensis TaxID=884348 RepID=UPI002304434B|nr:basic salivary proline-rich protein 1-like [Hemicordylus capensis]
MQKRKKKEPARGCKTRTGFRHGKGRSNSWFQTDKLLRGKQALRWEGKGAAAARRSRRTHLPVLLGSRQHRRVGKARPRGPRRGRAAVCVCWGQTGGGGPSPNPAAVLISSLTLFMEPPPPPPPPEFAPVTPQEAKRRGPLSDQKPAPSKPARATGGKQARAGGDPGHPRSAFRERAPSSASRSPPAPLAAAAPPSLKSPRVRRRGGRVRGQEPSPQRSPRGPRATAAGARLEEPEPPGGPSREAAAAATRVAQRKARGQKQAAGGLCVCDAPLLWKSQPPKTGRSPRPPRPPPPTPCLGSKDSQGGRSPV